MKKKRQGKAATGSARGRNDSLEVRLGSDEKQGFKEAAELSGLGVSAWVRERLRKVAASELEQAGKSVPFLH